MLRKYKILALFSLGLFSIFLSSMLSCTVQAQPTDQHIVVAPQCLINKLDVRYKTLSNANNLVLIEVNNAGVDKLIAAKNRREKTPCGGFMDVTHAWNEFNAKNGFAANNAKSFLTNYAQPPKSSLAAKNDSIKYEKQVNQLLKNMNPQDMWTDLTKLTRFNDRYSNSDNGVEAANWIKTQVETMANNTGHHDDVAVYTINTGYWYKQPSVVARIGTSSEPGIVIGGHMDTLSSLFTMMPGADDDGTGTVTVLEVARILLSSGMHFKKPIYLVWYAAEEMGLVGSQFVVADFLEKNIPIDAVMQLDMTGYAHKNDPTLWLYDDYTNKDLTAYLKTLIDVYVKQPVKHARCGYACSDHASWTAKGFAAVMPFEASFETDNPNIHSSNDTMDKLSLNHMTSFVKLATAFAVELAEPVA